MKARFEVVEKKIVQLLTPELKHQTLEMRDLHARVEIGCMTTNDDHGPYGMPYIMPRADIERFRVYTGTRENGSYNHHPHIAKFKGRYYFAWSNGLRDEERAGQKMRISSSADGKTWTKAKYVAELDPNEDKVHNCAGLYAGEDEMVIYCWSEKPLSEDCAIHTVDNTDDPLAHSSGIDTYVSTDGENWSLKQKDIIPRCGKPCMMFGAPKLTQEGMLLTGGSHKDGLVAYLWDASNPSGCPEIIKMPTTPGEGVFPWGECSWYQTDEGVIVTFWRDEAMSCRLYVNHSEDGGKSWSPLTISDFPDSMARVSAGQLPDGRYYLIGNSYTKLLDRMHLMISISEDGYKFSKMYTLIDDPTAQRAKGLLKGHGYQYPCAFVEGDKIMVGYSVNKEDIEFGIVDCSTL